MAISPTLKSMILVIGDNFQKYAITGQLGISSFDTEMEAFFNQLVADVADTVPTIDVKVGTADPSAGAGVVANTGDIYLRNTPGVDGGELWVKYGDLATAWSKVNTVAGMGLTDGHLFVGSALGIATDVPMSGEASIINTGAVTLSNSAVIGKVLTGFASGAGVVAATDSILAALQKIDGNEIIGHGLAVAALPSASFTDAAVTSKVITGFVSGAGVVAATDTILQALDKIDGNEIIGHGLAVAALPAASFTDAAVTSKVITGFVSGAGVVVATDTILQALDKIDGNEIAHKGVYKCMNVVPEKTSSLEENIAGLASAIALCNAVQGHMNTHAADGGEHFHGGIASPDTVNFPVAGVASDLPTLLTQTGLLLTAYAAHNADAILGGGGVFHNQQANSHALVSAVAPVTLAEAVTRLNDLKAKYNLHYPDAGTGGGTPHTAGTGPNEGTADAAYGAAILVADAAALVGDKVHWSILDGGAGAVKGVSAVAGAATITFTFSASPAADTVIGYMLMRAN